MQGDTLAETVASQLHSLPFGNASYRGLNLVFPAQDTAIRTVLEAVTSSLGAPQLSADQIGRVELALAEALNNVVEHAYRDLPLGTIRLACHPRPSALDLVITDHGRALPDFQIPDCACAHPDDLPEGGFGWFLIAQLTQRLSYVRTGNQNQLSLGFDFGA